MKTFLKLLIIFLIAMLLGNVAYGMYQEMKIGDKPSSNSLDNSNYTGNIEDYNSVTNENVENPSGEKSKWIKIEEEYKGYKVSAKLTIPKIDLETYVFSEYDEDAMWICPTKYFGPEPNEVGNYCIAAHNYDKENMFNHIIELEKGDVITLADNKNGEITYEVYDIYKVVPNDTEVLSQDTKGETELTLITCSDYSSKRIIVKARAW